MFVRPNATIWIAKCCLWIWTESESKVRGNLVRPFYRIKHMRCIVQRKRQDVRSAKFMIGKCFKTVGANCESPITIIVIDKSEMDWFTECINWIPNVLQVIIAERYWGYEAGLYTHVCPSCQTLIMVKLSSDEQCIISVAGHLGRATTFYLSWRNMQPKYCKIFCVYT